MKLIGAGLRRAGTLSQKVALEMLGLGPCYRMVTVQSIAVVRNSAAIETPGASAAG